MRYNNFEMIKSHKNGNFIQKLSNLLQNSTFEHIIGWDSSKKYIQILDPQLMQTEITPHYFRHRKFESFVRQLNLYGFRKVKFEGRLRFTHSILLNGQPLTAITAYKAKKNNKKNKQLQESSQSHLQELPSPNADEVRGNSMELRQPKETHESGQHQQRQGRDERRQPKGFCVPERTTCWVESDYWQWMQMMSMMVRGQAFNSMASWVPIASTPSQQS